MQTAAFITAPFQKAHRKRACERFLKPGEGHRGYMCDMPSDAEDWLNPTATHMRRPFVV